MYRYVDLVKKNSIVEFLKASNFLSDLICWKFEICPVPPVVAIPTFGAISREKLVVGYDKNAPEVRYILLKLYDGKVSPELMQNKDFAFLETLMTNMGILRN